MIFPYSGFGATDLSASSNTLVRLLLGLWRMVSLDRVGGRRDTALRKVANRFDIFSGCSPNHVGTSNTEKSLSISGRQNLSPPYVGVVDMENSSPERTAVALIFLTFSKVWGKTYARCRYAEPAQG